MNYFNYGQAVAQGNTNAMNQMQMQQLPEQLRMQKERHQMDQQAAQLQQAQHGLTHMLNKGRFVTDQSTYDMWKQEMGSLGIVQPEQMSQQYTPEYMNQVMGLTQKKLSSMTAEMKNYLFEQGLPKDQRQAFRNWKVSPQERIASTPGLTEAVGESQASIEGAKAGAEEQAKSNVQLMMRPKIQRAVKQAEAEAKARGESLTDLARAKAAQPGLIEVSNRLKTLAEIGTYTMTGRIRDEVVKQLGFGATKGATARAQMTAIVDNQVLPLLKQTFGAAFTVEEGKSLRATLLDIDATPEAKKATLDAFIEQKIRNIETKEQEVENLSVGQPSQAVGLSPQDQEALDWANANPNDPRAVQIKQHLGAQ